jgi:hypothetical protein
MLMNEDYKKISHSGFLLGAIGIYFLGLSLK